MKNIPKSLTVNGHTIEVRIVDRVSKTNEGLVGRAYLAQNKILIGRYWRGNKLAAPHMEETLMHELIHHVADKHKVSISEKQVDALSRGIYQVLKDNKLKFF